MGTVFCDKHWYRILAGAVEDTTKDILVVSPFIQASVVSNLVGKRHLRIRLITRFKLRDFFEGVSDLRALTVLLKKGAEIKGIRNLHAKLYIFDHKRAVVTSANLTEAALRRNHEFGVDTDNPELVKAAAGYFGGLWQGSGPPLTTEQLEEWQEQLSRALRECGRRPHPQVQLPDYGADLGYVEVASAADRRTSVEAAPQWFVKFFGKSSPRIDPDSPVIDAIKASDCDRVCAYPRGKRPRRVKEGAIMFMGTFVRGPDTLVFGRAVAMAYREGPDDATPAEIQQRPSRAKWPHYIRVKDPEFVAGALSNGVSLNVLMSDLGANAFGSTKRNLDSGEGNTNPRRAYQQMPAVELTKEAAEWLDARVEEAFQRCGTLALSQQDNH